ncbi:MAG: hypothetical protein L3J49_11225 [Desulfobulbaceae bacterium]|nr:hypothetical protein [Desulfobulbaceae bacterium]
MQIKNRPAFTMIELVFVIAFIPLILISTSTLSSNLTHIVLLIFFTAIAMAIQIEFAFKKRKKRNLFNIIINISFIGIIYYFLINNYDINFLKIIIFIFSLLFFWLNADIFLDEIKKYLFTRFTNRNKIKLYTPKDNIDKDIRNNYWSLVDPRNIKFIDSNNNLIEENKNLLSI